MISYLYRNILKPVLFQFDPEDVHDAFVKIGKAAGKFPPLQVMLGTLYGPPQTPGVRVDGITYQGPVMLAAGFDYNGHLSEVLWYLGLAGEEVGSVTARPCPGNARPRLKRLIKSRSIQVYKGLKNDGVESIIKRIKSKRIPEKFVLGISIAKTNDEKSVSLEEGIADYYHSLRRLTEERVGDFYTINISCPNAFGGEDFTTPERLELLLKALKQIEHSRPMYVKMPINLPWEKFLPLLQVIKAHKFHGVVIGNLNKNYDELEHPEEKPDIFRGGLSGRPCFERSNELIRKTRQLYPTDFTIIGCGGILSAQDAMEKLEAGADLLQLISGLIFTGPHLANEINRQFSRRSRSV
jgi:dihydroorotate dehydrogenase